jgi:hypothetical protein
MITVNLQTSAVEIETLGAWRLDGKTIEPGARLSVLPGLASDLVMRGKARRVVAAPVAAAPVAAAPEVVAPVVDAPLPAPETPPAPAVPVRGKK